MEQKRSKSANRQKPNQNKPVKQPANGNKPKSGNGRGVSRSAAIRAQKRSVEDAQKMLNQYANASQKVDKRERANTVVDDFNKLKITFLGGLDDVGEKNTTIIEYQNDAIVLDCGNNLGVDLPGINYEVIDPAYLETIKHKIKAYVITHGHLDHIGGLKHIVPKFPAPIYGTPYTIGIVEKTFEDVPAGQEHYTPKTITMSMDNHEKLKVGEFFIEFLRLTHAIPDAAAAVVKSPVGTVIAAGDFRLDPEPLDRMPSDIHRLKELGDEGVLALLSDSTNAEKEGRTPTEHTLQKSFTDIIKTAPGRIMVAVFSSNMNRTQMIINAAVESGRKVALDGRSMMAYAEIAVRQGLLRVPKGTIMAMKDAANVPDDQLLVMCTGGQGEPNAALQRMSEGNHQYIKLKPGDTVVVSSTPIPGNEVRYDAIGNRIAKLGAHLFRHPTHEIDGCGPLHVSGHGRREELREMIRYVRPRFHIPVHGGMLRRRYHAELAIQEGWKRSNVILANNGESYLLTTDKAEPAGEVPHGSLLVDQTGAIVSNVVVKDRIMLASEGMVAVVLTIDKKTGSLLTSPDILTRGFIYIRDSEELMNGLRTELKRAVQQRYKRVDLDRFKQELKEHVTHYLYEQTQRSPIVIPVVNVIGGKANGDNNKSKNKQDDKSPEQMADEQQQRFAELRAKLLSSAKKGD
ncbi:ribonuclease J [Candidatus Saccharibacteria bacterium]|nr:ribonuclease J [Candidatus Saccharibacteria bacterium]